jgi:hypothetical protein
MGHRTTINGPLTWSLLFITAVVVMLLVQLPSVMRAGFAPGVSNVDVSERLAAMMTEHDNHQTAYRDRFNGRSVFFKPKRPPAPRPPRSTTPIVRAPDPTPTVPTEPSAPTAPSTYRGPAIMAIVGNQVWFEGDLRLTVGDEEVDGVEVKGVNAPWSATVAYNGFDFDVDLFQRFSAPVFLTEGDGGPERSDPAFFQSPDDATGGAGRVRVPRGSGSPAGPSAADPPRPRKPTRPPE